MNAIEGTRPCVGREENSSETCEKYDDRNYALTTSESPNQAEHSFWARPQNQWNCSAEQMDETFDSLDAATVRYVKNRGERA